MYNPHNRLIAPLALKLLHLSARRQIPETLPVLWHSPSDTDVFGVGDTILAAWTAERAVVSPFFQLCISTEAVEDSVSADVTCGTTVWPVVTSSAEGLYSTSLSAPNVTSTSPVFLQMRDDFGSLARSPVFTLDPIAPFASESGTGSPSSDPSATTAAPEPPPSSSSSSSPSATSQTQNEYFTARKQSDDSLASAITWQSPSSDDVFGSGDTIIGRWQTEKAAVSPSFQLCMSTDAGADTGSADSTCGTTVWPTVTSDAGTYSVSLSAPNITSASHFILRMTDNFGSTAESPVFKLDPNASSASETSTELPSSTAAFMTTSTAASPSSSPPYPASSSNASQIHNGTTPNAAPQISQNPNSEPDVLASRQPPPVAAYAVPLSVVSAIILAAGIMSLRHKQKLKADRLRDAVTANLDPSASVGSFKSADEVGHALNVLSRNELGYSGAPTVPVPVPLFMPVDHRWESESRGSTRRAYPPSLYSWDRESTYTTPNYARSWASNHSRQMSDRPRQTSNHLRQISSHSRQTSNHSNSSNYRPFQQLPPSQLRPYLPPLSTSNRAFFDEGDTGVTGDVLSEYMVPSPILPPGMTVPPPRPPERLHVRVESPGRGPQGTTRRLTEYLQPNPYGVVAENLRFARS
ncbi:uncharacterized protein LACBIDRAFT_297900 [Laccaria bicolor S238N-H82]|uniref:Predicted protein n=1 Tax=Laccaria bicolor (strain S238N-H82 / ATCC MYA-4686) TaxID=486041 RepID=B0DB60_LACBS|nr:uncharacterized protein LACBIDRAFT_297900 [Laccaria bicolor S238N-H82]EDR08333.1 predicted protein [Laccaria bicolor S238N-H82]|eukprot:XP_001881403.1 predicted protein [Laccaria bicolor S238N-H82]